MPVGQALDIDGVTYVKTATAPAIEVAPGDFVRATVTTADDADLWATARSIIRRAPAAFERDELATLDLQSAWGR